jgi:hypothetical protein
LYAIVAPAQSFCDNGNSFIFPGGSKIPVKVGQCSRLKCFLVGHSPRFLTRKGIITGIINDENHSYNPDNNEYFSDLKDNILSKARHAKQGIHSA